MRRVAAGLAVAALGIGCAGEGAPPGPSIDKVLVISIDTLRADYLGTYNPGLATSPNIDAFARDAFVFDDAITQAANTLPAHMSIFYSVHPLVHRARLPGPNGERRHPYVLLEPPLEALQAEGFRTGAFTGGGQLRPQFGFDRGFQDYVLVNRRELRRAGEDHLEVLRTRGVDWMEANRDQSFLLFLHTYEAHTPYQPPVSYRDKWVAAAEAGDWSDPYLSTEERVRYAAQVEYIDDFFGDLLADVERLGLTDELMIVFLSDHGESLGERGVQGHSHFYTEQLRIPLIVRVPGMGGGRVDAPVEAIDVMPTTFAVLGLEPPYPFQGIDLLPLMAGSGAIDPARVRSAQNRGGISVQQAPWKLIYYPDLDNPTELYNTARDPAELDNVAAEHPDVVAALQQRYAELVAESEPLIQLFPQEGGQMTLDEATREQLRALGYLR